MDIDVVFTWVDGSDPNHLKARNKFIFGNNRKPEGDVSSYRWESSGEIIQSVKSVREYAPWVRNIYVVTSLGQKVPKEIGPLVKQINDWDILPKGVVPSFNSHSFESVIHRIPGIANRIIYMCDDEFIGKPVNPENFFTTKGIVIHVGKANAHTGIPSNDVPAHLAARMNNSTLLARARCFSDKCKAISHQARPILRDELAALWDHKIIGPVLRRTSRSRIRAYTDVEPIGLCMMYSLFTNPGTVQYTLGGPRGLTAAYFSVNDTVHLSAMFNKILTKRPHMYCLNSVMSRPRPAFHNGLRIYLPHNVSRENANKLRVKHNLLKKRKERPLGSLTNVRTYVKSGFQKNDFATMQGLSLPRL